MYDKTVRRRRAVLAVLVALSLVLLTAYFGEPVGGGLHSVQRGFLEVVAPIQEGASRALKPFRDLFGWFGDTLKAKGQRDDLRRQLDALRTQSIQDAAALRENAQLKSLLRRDNELKLGSYHPVTSRVIGRSPTVWFSTVNVDRGTNDGVRVDQPVVNADGLVGKVTAVTPQASVVTLITDHTSGVSARVNSTGAVGIVQPAVGDPNDLLMQYLRRGGHVKRNDIIVTAGTTSSRLESLFPPGIPIGRVTRVDDQALFRGVHIRPFASLPQLDYVQILTRHGSATGSTSNATARSTARSTATASTRP